MQSLWGGGLLLGIKPEQTRHKRLAMELFTEHAEAIDIPIVVFAIGYNRFRGHGDFLSIFDEHISALIEKRRFQLEIVDL